MKTVLIAGGAGFIGSHLCERLVREGRHVICMDNLVTGNLRNIEPLLQCPGFTVIQHDVAKPLPSLPDVDAIYHLASPASPTAYQRYPIQTLVAGSDGTHQLLKLAARNDARFLFASTSEVYGDPLEHPQREDYWGNVNPVGPRGVYDEAKRFGEALTTAFRATYALSTGIVRIFNTYGPRMRPDDGRAIPTFIRQALAGEPLTVAGDGSQTRSICYVDDTVRGVVALALSRHEGPVNIGNPDEVSMLELAERIRDLTGSSSTIDHVDLPVDDPKVRRPDTSLARQLLGWEPQVASDEGLDRTLAWFSAALSARP